LIAAAQARHDGSDLDRGGFLRGWFLRHAWMLRNASPGQAVESGMSRVPWHFLRNRHPPAHLVAGAIQADRPLADSDLKKVQTGLERLVGKLEPAGKYATTIVTDGGSSEVHFAFEHEGDARRLAAAVNAEATVAYPGWATQQAFLLRDVAVAAPLASFPLPTTRRPARDKLKHEIYALGKIIEANASTLTSKTMNDEDREVLQRQMATRMAHLKLLQQRLDRLSNYNALSTGRGDLSRGRR